MVNAIMTGIIMLMIASIWTAIMSHMISLYKKAV